MKRSVLYLGTDADLGAALPLLSALGTHGAKVACAILADREGPAETLGLARRLDAPSTANLGAWFDGALPGGGRAVLCAISNEHRDRQRAFAQCLWSALGLDSHRWVPAIIHAEAGVAKAAAEVRERLNAPVATLVDCKSATGITGTALAIADRILVAATDEQQNDRLLVFAGGVDPVHDARGVLYRRDAGQKQAAKDKLRRQLGLPPRAHAPVIAVIPGGAGPRADASPWRPALVDNLAATGAQLVLAGHHADAETTVTFKTAASRHPSRVAVAQSSWRAVAGADFALIDSATPSTGVEALWPLCYATLPIAPRTGVFADRLVDLDPRTRSGTGILFDPRADDAVVAAVRRAVRAFGQEGFTAIGHRAGAVDLSWTHAARRLIAVYDALSPVAPGGVSPEASGQPAAAR